MEIPTKAVVITVAAAVIVAAISISGLLFTKAGITKTDTYMGFVKIKDFGDWHIIDNGEPFNLECEYKISLKSWLNERVDKSIPSRILISADKVSDQNITAAFFGGPQDATIIRLIVDRGTKTKAQEFTGALHEGVIVSERCMPPAVKREGA